MEWSNWLTLFLSFSLSLSYFLSFSLSPSLSSCCIKGSHSSSKRTQTNQIFSLTLTDIFTQISICQPKVCWAEGRGVRCKCAAVGDVLICQGNPVLCCAAFLLPTDLILKSFSAFTQIKMMTTLAKRQLWQRHRQRDRNWVGRAENIVATLALRRNVYASLCPGRSWG